MSQVLELVSASPHRCCSAVYSDFTALLSQENYFQVALDVLLPVLRGDLRLPEVSTSSDVYCASRCYCAYIVHKIYTPHPIALNPFQSALQASFIDDTATSPMVATTSSSLNVPGSASWLSRSERLVNTVLGIILADHGDELDGLVPSEELERPAAPVVVLQSPNFQHPSNPGSEAKDPESPPPSTPHLTPRIGIRTSLSPARLQSSDWPTLLSQAQRRVLTLSEQRVVLNALPTAPIQQLRTYLHTNKISSLASFNGRLSTPAVARFLFENDVEEDMNEWYLEVVDALASLPPTLSSCDLIGGLVRMEREKAKRSSPLSAPSKPGIRPLVVEPFISHCLQIIDGYERETEEEGETIDGDEKMGRAVQLLSRFVMAVIRADSASSPLPPQNKPLPPTGGNIASTSLAPSTKEPTQYPTSSFSEGLVVELTTFALHHSHFTEANTLYRTLVLSRGPD